MRSLPRKIMGPAWDCPSAAQSSNRIAAACAPPTTLRAAQVFTSFYPPKPRHMNDMSKPRSAAWAEPSAIARYAIAVLSVAIAIVAAELLTRTLHTEPIASSMLCAVMFAAWFGGFGPGLLGVRRASLWGQY